MVCSRPVTFVLVPGAWLGAWCWRWVAAGLRATGVPVRAVDLLGVVDDGAFSFDRHVDAVRRTVDCSSGPVVLVGHSYGGSVVTAATSGIASRTASVLFLDATAPRSGQSTADTWPPRLRAELASAVDSRGMLPPPAGAELPQLGETD
jgi:pimeloyl-ACP methyl ester carboxylesterase